MLLIYSKYYFAANKRKACDNLHIPHYNKSTPITKKQKRKYNISTSSINILL